jgi:ATP-dependent RNA helicase DeaD
MDQFREGHINILVATDLAARGIDVKEISYVVNYHLPDAYESRAP